MLLEGNYSSKNTEIKKREYGEMTEKPRSYFLFMQNSHSSMPKEAV
jgi:hypothetical protein